MPAPAVLHREARIDTIPSQVLEINTATNATGLGRGLTAGRKRAFDEISHDEESFTRRHLAIEGSIFFRASKKAPRSFLWRVLNERRLLEIQCVDLVRDARPDAKGVGAGLTVRISLPSPALQSGIALASAEENDALNVFVITSAHELYTFTFGLDLFLRNSVPADLDPTSTFRRFSPASFSFRHPYRLIAVSSLELFVSLHDGGIMRLDRESKQSGVKWRETFFHEGGWSGTLKGLIPFNRPQTVRYGTTELDSNAIVAIAKGPDGKHIWTLTLDYLLKVWSTKTGKIVVQIDLLGEHSDVEEKKRQVRHVMSAEQGNLMQIIRPAGVVEDKEDACNKYFLVIHTPNDHQFRFFAVQTTFSSIEGDGVRCQDILPDSKLVPPVDDLLNTNIWHLDNFALKAGPEWMSCQLWIMVRSGANCKTFLNSFDLLDERGSPVELSEQWESGWTAVDSASQTVDELRQLVAYAELGAFSESAATTPTERWLDFLFYPYRFSEASLETALHIFRKNRGLSGSAGHGLKSEDQPLKERLTASIASKVVLQRHGHDSPNYDKYLADLHAQWNDFFSILSHLQTRRADTIGFSFDAAENLPWAICADFVAPIRSCSRFELTTLNKHLLWDIDTLDESVYQQIFPGAEEVTQVGVLAAARQLRLKFSAASVEKLWSASVTRSLESDPELSDNGFVQSLSDHCGFAQEVSDDDFEALTAAAEVFGSLGSLSEYEFLGILESMEEDAEPVASRRLFDQCRYGVHMSITSVQEILLRAQAALLDLLILVVFMAGEVEPQELHKDFRANDVYDAIIRRIRYMELRLWLVGNVRQVASVSSPDTMICTWYETIFLDDWDSQPGKSGSALSELLTTWSTRWAFGLELREENWAGVTEHIMTNLLRYKSSEQALQFLPFMFESTATSDFLKGQLHLMTGDYDLASFEFKAASEDLSRVRYDKSSVVWQLLSPEEFNALGAGSSRYFQLVASFFEKLKAFSYTAEFAELALRCFEPEADVDQSIAEIDVRKSQSNRRADEAIADTMEEIRLLQLRTTRDEILNRLFNALVQTGRFEQAYQTLTTVTNPIQQRANLDTLLQTCVSKDAISTILGLSMTDDLAQEADGILLSMAKRHTGTGLASNPRYHRILFAFRTRRQDYRGAAAILYEHLEYLRDGRKLAAKDPEDETLINTYVLLINVLACCGKDEGWLLADPVSGIHAVETKRRLITLDDIRREYSAELDRRSDLMHGRFPVMGGSDMMDVF